MDCLLECHYGREPDDLHDQPAQFLPRKQSSINVHPIPEQTVGRAFGMRQFPRNKRFSCTPSYELR